MDPTALLEDILSILQYGSKTGLAADECEDLLESIHSLGEWIKRGGFLPKQWQEKRGRKRVYVDSYQKQKKEAK